MGWGEGGRVEWGGVRGEEWEGKSGVGKIGGGGGRGGTHGEGSGMM